MSGTLKNLYRLLYGKRVLITQPIAARWSAELPFVLLAGLVLLAFLFGGSARPDAVYGALLKIGSALALAGAGLTLRRDHLKAHKGLCVLAVAVLALPLLQLLPLPPGLANGFPGHAIISDIDRANGFNDVWRPITLSPEATRSVFWSLMLPLAVLLLGIQLTIEQRVRMVTVFLSIGFASAMLGFLQTMGDADGALYIHEITNYGLPVGLFANRNHQALFLALMIPLLFVRYRMAMFGDPGLSERAQNFRLLAKILILGGTFVLASLILINGSRAGLTVAAVALAMLPFVIGWRIWPHVSLSRLSDARNNRLLRLLAAFVGLIVLVAIAVWLRRANALDRLLATDPENELRLAIIPTLWKMVDDFFAFGSGLGTFEIAFKIYEPLDLLSPTFMNHAHNDWVETIITGGLPAGLILLGASAAYCRTALRALKQSPRRRQDFLARAGLVVILLIAVASLSDYPLRTASIGALFAFCSVCLVGPMPERTKVSAGPVERALLLAGTLILGFAVALSASPKSDDALDAPAGPLGASEKKIAAAEARLRSEPLDGAALRERAMAMSDEKGGENLIFLKLAERLSRRDVNTQIELLNAAAQKGDIPGVLAHYNRLLSVAPDLGQLLLPKLAAALSDPSVRRGLEPYASRLWFNGFLDAALREASDPRDVLRLMEEASLLSPGRLPPEMVSRLVRTLVMKGYSSEARRAAAAMAWDPALFTDLGITERTIDPKFKPFSWNLASKPEIEVEFSDGNGAAISPANETRQEALSRVTLLPPGEYLFEQTVVYGDPPFVQLKWTLTCFAEPSMPLQWVQQLPAVSGRVTYRSRLVISDRCGSQLWRLWTVGQDVQTPSGVKLSRLKLSPL